MRTILLSAFLLQTTFVSGQVTVIRPERMATHVKVLSNDQTEGRGVGQRGGDLATEYIAGQFTIMHAKPAGDNGTYYQRVPMVGVETEKTASLEAVRGGSNVSFDWLKDFVGVTQQQKTDAYVNADAIFIGHGIVAPEFGWDDYKGTDVTGKVVVLFTNEPPSTDPKFFGGKALTYFGRWTYKYEEAARHGAAAVLIIHTTPTAGYGWEVVRNSWGKEDPQLKLESGTPALAFAGWVSESAGKRLLELAGKSVDQLLAAANSKSFRPIPLGIKIQGRFPAKVRDIESRNVVAMVPGSDPVLKNEYVLFTAHWDHLGIGTPVNGDKIYNGAVDNATGCAVLMEIAEAWASQPQKPRRTAVFLSVTAEEAGLRGSEYYARHPVFPLSKTALDLNFDSIYPFGATTDIAVTGADRTTAWPVVEAVAARMKLQILPEAHPEQGEYYRSDHFSLARAGVPAFSVALGTHFPGKPDDYGEKIFEEYNTKHYHQPSDEFQADWDFGGLEEVAKFGFNLGEAVANQPKLPTWKPGDEFLPARQKSEAASR